VLERDEETLSELSIEAVGDRRMGDVEEEKV
jgi:hypothetical protein